MTCLSEVLIDGKFDHVCQAHLKVYASVCQTNVSFVFDTIMEGTTTSSNLSEKEFLLYFISLYRALLQLSIKSKEYLDKNKGNTAMKKITNLFNIRRPNITEDDVKKNSMYNKRKCKNTSLFTLDRIQQSPAKTINK